MIELKQVTKRFQAQQVLKGMSFRVNKGEVLGLLGPNGSGKTTTIRLINGVIQADTGSITVAGLDPHRDGEAIRRKAGILTETAGFYAHMTALENLRFYGDMYGVKGDARANQLLEEFGLGPHRDRKVGTFSTGMKKRLGLARALLHKPEILFLDEPTNGLDPEGIQQVLQEITRLNRTEGMTILICSHLLQQVEAVCQRYVFMEGGRVLDEGTAADLEAKYLTEVRLLVETDLALAGDSYRGLPVQSAGAGRLQFTLPTREAIPGLLRDLLAEASVFTATQVERDLEALYFKIREGARHE